MALNTANSRCFPHDMPALFPVLPMHLMQSAAEKREREREGQCNGWHQPTYFLTNKRMNERTNDEITQLSPLSIFFSFHFIPLTLLPLLSLSSLSLFPLSFPSLFLLLRLDLFIVTFHHTLPSLFLLFLPFSLSPSSSHFHLSHFLLSFVS